MTKFSMHLYPNTVAASIGKCKHSQFGTKWSWF